jgi:hypothetical protein
MNFENLGTRIAENGAWNQKICSLEAFRGKTVFLEGSRAILEFLEWLEGLGTKNRGSCKFWGFFRHSCEFWGFFRYICRILQGLKWFRTY